MRVRLAAGVNPGAPRTDTATMERLVPLANTCPPALRRAARWLAVALVAGVLGHLVLSSGGDGTPETVSYTHLTLPTNSRV